MKMMFLVKIIIKWSLFFGDILRENLENCSYSGVFKTNQKGWWCPEVLGGLNAIQYFLMILGTSFNFPGSSVWQLKQKVFQALDSFHAFCAEPASRQKGENEQRIRTILQPLKLLSPAEVRELCQVLQHCTEVFPSCFDLLQLLLRESMLQDQFWSWNALTW